MAIKLNTFIDIISTEPVKDADGFAQKGDTIIASVRAYKEDKHGSERWVNMAVFADAEAIFRFRRIPGVTVDTKNIIVCADGRYRIISSEDVSGRGMYMECVCARTESSVE